MDEEEFLSYTPPQVAKILGVGEGTVRREIRRGLIDAWKPGSKDWRITRKAVARYVAGKEEDNRNGIEWDMDGNRR